MGCRGGAGIAPCVRSEGAFAPRDRAGGWVGNTKSTRLIPQGSGTGKHVPYKLLVKLHDAYAKVRNFFKNILIDHLPKVYMKLRMLKHRKKAKA